MSQNNVLLSLLDELKSQCNKYTNQECQTLACLKRGGWKRGEQVKYRISTCEKHEQATQLMKLIAAKKLLND